MQRLNRLFLRKLTTTSTSTSTIKEINQIPSFIKNNHLWNTSCSFINGNFIYYNNSNSNNNNNNNNNNKEQFPVYNPATNEIIAYYPKLKLEDIQPCEEISFNTWKIWKNTTTKERSKILRKMSDLMHHYIDDLAHIITIEAGKPLAEARGEVLYAASFFEFYGEEAKRIYGDIIPPIIHGRKYLTIKQPVGPAAMITPWNFPSAMITRKLAPALAAGCTATIKPAEETPLSAFAICAIANEAGLPPGVLNVVTVAREDVQSIGKHFCNSHLYRKISFTGSTNVGKWLMQESASTVKKLSLENGGNAPFIVFDDADLELAVKAVLAAKFRNAGQTCVCANRIFVQDSIYDKFADMLTEKVSAYRCGNGLHSSTTMGPLINRAGLEKTKRHVEDCVSKGAIVRCGGHEHYELNKNGGNFFVPTVLTEVTPAMKPYYEETFGPIAPLFRFKTDKEAIQLANDTRAGLAGYACTSNLSRAFHVAEALECGLVGINEGAISNEVIPFGGMKESGIGREGGRQGIDAFVETKYINITTDVAVY